MKKLLVFALVAMVAGFAGAQTLSWIGDSYKIGRASCRERV